MPQERLCPLQQLGIKGASSLTSKSGKKDRKMISRSQVEIGITKPLTNRHIADSLSVELAIDPKYYLSDWKK